MRIRKASFAHLQRLVDRHGILGERDLGLESDLGPFVFEREQIYLMTRAKGIFKPKAMEEMLSIKTVIPREQRVTRYEDQTRVKADTFDSVESVAYSFRGSDPDHSDNQLLRRAAEKQLPLIYFLGVGPNRYQAIFPVFLSSWNPNSLSVNVTFSMMGREELTIPTEFIERKYALREVQFRLHQSLFREDMLVAYGKRCAHSGLPEERLLDAAHIIPDGDDELGQPMVQNGLLLSKTHHAAFDAHLIGISPDYRIHVSEQLLVQHDGSELEALKKLNGELLRRPKREEDWPDQERLAKRFEDFRAFV